jgi:transposase
MSRINKTTIYAIKWLNSQGYDIESISNELSVSKKQIETHIEQPQPVQVSQEEPAKITPKNLMITQTSVKKTNNVAIMTGEASMLSDHIKKNQKANTKNQTGIFRPKQ